MRGRHARPSRWRRRIRKFGLAEWSAIATILALPLALLGLYANAGDRRSTDPPVVKAGSTTSTTQGDADSAETGSASSTSGEPTTTPRRPVRDLVAVTVDSDPDRLDLGEVWMSYVVPHSLASIERQYPKGGSGPSGCPGRFRWWRSIGAVEGKSRFKVKLAGLADTSIVEARPRILRRAPARKGIGLVCGPEGSVEVRNVVVELEAPNRVYHVEGSEEEQNLKRRPFVLSLRKGEVEVLDVIASARSHYYEWVFELTITHRGERYTVTVDDHGRPFRTTSATNASAVYVFDCCPAVGVYTLRQLPKGDLGCDPTSPVGVCV